MPRECLGAGIAAGEVVLYVYVYVKKGGGGGVSFLIECIEDYEGPELDIK